MTTLRPSLSLLALCVLAGPAPADEGPDPVRLRDELRAMEALLDSTVEQVSRPNPGFLLAGSPSCRGYLLKGYGFVFVLPARWLPVRSAGLRGRRPGMRSTTTESIVVIRDRRDPGLRELERQVQAFQEEAEQTRSEAERAFEEMTREIRLRIAASQVAWGDMPQGPPLLPVLAPAPPEAPTAPAAPEGTKEPPDPAKAQEAPPPAPPDALPLPPPAGPLAPGAPPWRNWGEPEEQEDRRPERLVADVRDAVIAALEAHGPSLSSLRPDETISVVVDFVAGAPFLDDDARPARSLTLRVRKRDLDDRRAGRLSPDELRRRVEATEY
ncbi:MAG TPA: hypothetical protein VMV21_09245 [Vicinamibacteria bacterium]|nr:hypothetical protein [Vicinamibacteria bacterium]